MSFDSWLAALDARHLADLRPQEVTRALRALSSDYVHRRRRLQAGADSLQGRGKRAAFALYYGPLHFLVVREIVRRTGLGEPPGPILDLGCGTGAAGAAWADAVGTRPEVVGVDRLGWALEEAAWTYRQFALPHRTLRGSLADPRVLRRAGRAGYVLAWSVNELDERSRLRLKSLLLERTRAGDAVLIVEPIARGVAPWWESWADAFAAGGGSAGDWRFSLPLPDRVASLARAAGLDAREQTARAIWLAR